jgi:carbonyl reductase 1
MDFTSSRTLRTLFVSSLFLTQQAFALPTTSINPQGTNNSMSRVAVVTGANKGIGYFIGLQLAQTGLFSNVILGCRDENRGKAAVNSMVQSLNESKCQCEVSYEPLTIGDIDSHKAFVQHMKEKFDKVDVLVNNAGIAFKNADPTPFKDQCKPTLGINFHGTVDFTERMFPLVRKGADARIVNVASMAGRLKQIQSKELRDRFKDPSLTAQELKDLVHNFETDVLDGTHFEKGWGRSNYSFSKLATFYSISDTLPLIQKLDLIPKVNSTLEVGLLRYHPSTRRATLKETQRALLLYRIKLIVKLIHQDDYPNMLQLMAEPSNIETY